MPLVFIVTVLCVVLVGATLSLQAPINAALARSLNAPMAAAAISFGIGFVALGALAFARGEGLAFSSVKSVPLWAYSGGLLGALWVFAAILSVGQLGVVTMITAMIMGQLLCAVLLDAYGAFGVPVREISWSRIAAIAFVAVGLILSRG